MKKKNKIVVISGNNKRKEFDVDPEKVTVWMLGDRKKGWIPNKKHYTNFRRQLKRALKNPKDNHIVFHFGVECMQVDT